MESYTTGELLKEVARRRKRQTKTCPMAGLGYKSCQVTFEGIGPRIYCSRACADHAYYLEHKAERNAATVQARRARRPRPGEPGGG